MTSSGPSVTGLYSEAPAAPLLKGESRPTEVPGITKPYSPCYFIRHMGSKERQPNPEQFGQLATILDDVFIQRHDLYAKQLDNGRYVCVREPLTQAHIEAHLRGDITLGTYLLDAASKGRFLVLDADDDPDWRRLQGVSTVMEGMETESYLERSRRGGHLWLFFEKSLPGREIRKFGQGLLKHLNIDSVELFPKQNKLKTGPGSLVRLPFGVHRRSGYRYGFYNTQGHPIAPALSWQIMVLEDRETVPTAVFEQFRDIGSRKPERRGSEGAGRPKRATSEYEEGLLPSTRIKAAISVKEFVSQYVELSPSGTGLCPFHDDNDPSFNVNDDENYWFCFTCEKGGSIIDFWMMFKGCDFQAAIRQ